MSSIDSWRRKQQHKKRGALIAVALVAVIAVLAGFMWWNGSSGHKQQGSGVTAMRNNDIGAGVTANGEKVPSGIKAVAVKGELPPLKHVVSATPLIDFTPSGKLAAPLTLRFKLTKQVDPKDPNFVYATRETNKDPWEYIHATPTSDGRFVEVTVTHFSFGAVLHLSISPWENELVHNPFFNSDDALDLQQEFKDNLTGGWTTRAKKPTCSNESQARQDDYVIDSEGKGTLYWCFGIKNGKRVLKVVNRKHYPLDITHENMQVVSAGHILVNLDQLARLTTGSNKHTILFPGDTAVFSIDLKMNTLARLKTSYSLTSGGAASLGALQTAVLTVNSAAVTSKAPGAQKLSKQEAYKVMNYLLQSKDCYDAVASSNEADLTLDCIGAADPDKLSKESPKLGAVGLLASFVKGVGSLGDKLRAIISGNVDSLNGEANYGIVIRRFDPIAPYVGVWDNFLDDDPGRYALMLAVSPENSVYQELSIAGQVSSESSGISKVRRVATGNQMTFVVVDDHIAGLPAGSKLTVKVMGPHEVHIDVPSLGISEDLKLTTRNYKALNPHGT